MVDFALNMKPSMAFARGFEESISVTANVLFRVEQMILQRWSLSLCGRSTRAAECTVQFKLLAAFYFALYPVPKAGNGLGVTTRSAYYNK